MKTSLQIAEDAAWRRTDIMDTARAIDALVDAECERRFKPLIAAVERVATELGKRGLIDLSDDLRMSVKKLRSTSDLKPS